ncbi:MAG TPA: carbonic anhydrase [Pseudohaliea sp.]|nr:carbonic anhydrase [Pseudohaliea sp.]
MRKLLAGVYKFKTEIYPERRELFTELSSAQHPRILFITCSDSRIDPNLVTQAAPGDLFICRNAGNIVPPHERYAGGTTAAIEYAVSALKVKHVVLCGHTDCGAIKGAMAPDELADLPHTSDWLGHTLAAVATVRARHGAIRDEHLSELTEENVVLQLRHLMTHPAVAAAIASADLELHGWIYDIGRGDIRCYDERERVWRSVEDAYREQPDVAAAIAAELPAGH